MRRKKLLKSGGGEKGEAILPSPLPFSKPVSWEYFSLLSRLANFFLTQIPQIYFPACLPPHLPLPISSGEFEDHSATALDCSSNLRGSDAQLFGGGKLPDQLIDHCECNREAFLFVHLHFPWILLFPAQFNSHWCEHPSQLEIDLSWDYFFSGWISWRTDLFTVND